MNTRFQQKFLEEIKLEQKRSELAALRARHVKALAVLQHLHEEIASFEGVYQETLGRRMAELDRLEAEISRLSGFPEWESEPDDEPCPGARSGAFAGNDGPDRFSESSDSDRFTGGDPNFETEFQDIKSLYREVAKAIHPDLAFACSCKLDRHELMSKANRAYAEDDRRTLQEILRNWRRSAHLPERGGIAGELTRLIRQIAREQQEIRAVNAKVEELRSSYICRFKQRVDAKRAMGRDLFAELIEAAEQNIEGALKRLAFLKGERQEEPPHRREKPKRSILFPAGLSCGTLYLRDRTSLAYSKWKKLGQASGALQIDLDMAVRLDIKEGTGLKLSHMQKLHPDDIQSLFLYDVGDADIGWILHLTGLEELYLSGLQLTDAALSGISFLTNLKRIFLYHTGISDKGLIHLHRLPSLSGLTSSGNSITDEGLAGFQQAIPRVKTVSFPWKR